MDPEQGERNGDEDEIEDVTTQIYRPEDEIEEVTQENRAGRDKVSSTFSQPNLGSPVPPFAGAGSPYG